MTDDVITLLRRHDPAARLRPMPETAAQAMRDQIVHAPPVRTARRRRRRLTLLAVAAAVMTLGAATAVYSSISGDDSASTVQAQYAAVTRTIQLPPGAHWKALDLPPNSVFGREFALQAAVGQAQCAWYSTWIAAATSGDHALVTRSYAHARTLRAMMPLHPAGAPEDAGGYDRGTLQMVDREISTAHRGDFRLLRQDLRANCG